MDTQQHHLEHNKVNIAYREEGSGDTTLLFVHGAFINKEYWKDQVSYFSKDYHVVTLDLGGHGQSGINRSSWTIAEFAQDVIMLIKTLNLKNVVLIGHSMGADVCLEIADQYPDLIIGLVAVDYFKNAGTAMPPEVQKQVNSILSQLKTNFSDTTEAYVRQGLITEQTDRDLAQRVIADYRNAYQEMGIQNIEEVFGFYSRQRVLLQRLQFKLHLINVDYRPTNEALLKKFAGDGYELIQIQGTSHYPMLENSTALNTALAEVIRKCVNDQRLIHFSEEIN